MHPAVEFHFDFGSPNAYLAHLVVPEIERRTGVRFAYVPVLLGGVFKATNNVSPAVVEAALRESGLPASDLLALAADAGVKQELIANTERSVARGSFGSPSFFVGDELFFGKDRLREVEEEIEAQKQR
jgi:2-hydroxychromene-2-carboxylate isomerase